MDATVDTLCASDADGRYRGLVFRGAPAKTSLRPIVSVPAPRPRVAGTAAEEPVESATAEELDFLRFVLARGRQSLESYRLAPLVRRVPACLRALRVDSLEAAKQALEQEPRRSQTALDSLLIGATSFYRDTAVFDFVRESVLPDVFANSERARILSAACSDGSELYTIAALVDARERLEDADLWGIDCRPAAIESARAGNYAEGALESLPQTLREKCLDWDGKRAQVCDRLRGATNWAIGNALGPSRFGRWNLILCRNLAIYLRPTATLTLWRNLTHALEPGGYLVVGRAEKPRAPGLFRVGPCTYRKNA